MQKSIDVPKLPPVGTVFVVTKDRTTSASAKIAKTGFLCKTTRNTGVVVNPMYTYYSNLDFNFQENEWIHGNGIWNWRLDELEEIILIQEDI